MVEPSEPFGLCMIITFFRVNGRKNNKKEDENVFGVWNLFQFAICYVLTSTVSEIIEKQKFLLHWLELGTMELGTMELGTMELGTMSFIQWGRYNEQVGTMYK